MNDPISRFLKNSLPPAVVRFIQGCRYRGIYEHSQLFFQQAKMERIFRRNNHGRPSDSFVLKKGIEFRIHPKAKEAFQYFAFTDPEMVEEMNGFMRLARKRTCLLDIGALYGIFSLAFSSRKTAKSYSFEPFQESFEILSSHAKLNPEMQIFPVFSAVGEKKGSVEMFQSGFHLICKGEGDQNETARACPMTSIDDFVRERHVLPDTLKIDVEGFEGKVLQGGQKFLSENDPLIFLELHPLQLSNYHSSAQEVIHLLTKFGYRFFTPDFRPVRAEVDFAGIEQKVVLRLICCKSPTIPA